MAHKLIAKTDRIEEGQEVNKSDPGHNLPLLSTSPQLPTQRPISGSLPLDFRASSDGGELAPAIVFAPPHLRAAELRLLLSSPADGTQPATDANAARPNALVATDSAALATASDASIDEQFLQHAQAMLADGGSDGLQSQFKASPTNASYDFDEYVFLRNIEDPYIHGLTAGPGTSQPIPSDPRFQRFVNEAEKGIAMFVDYVCESLGIYLFGGGPTKILRDWWFDVCAIRAFNRFNRYSRATLQALTARNEHIEIPSPEAYYGIALAAWLQHTVEEEVKNYIIRFSEKDASAALGKLLTVAYWEDVLDSVFEEAFSGIDQVDPTAPEREYPFEPFPADEVLFGLQVVHRQNWRLLGYARGELAKSIPLGPRETKKVSVKILRRKKVARSAEEATSLETTSEASTTTKDTSEVVAEASEKLNRHAEAEVSGGYMDFVRAKVSGGVTQDLASSSKGTKTSLNERMEKTASRMKRDTKVTVSTESEESFEETRASELTNPNDEIGVTYLYHQLQQRYWVSTEIAEVHSAVFVPEPLPAWEDITEDWVRDHGDLIAGALLDASLVPILTAIRKEPADLAYGETAIFTSAAQAGIGAAQNYKGLQDGGSMPDLLASGQQFYERDFERRNSLAMDQARRMRQSQALLTHIRRNILHYMRAIWASEDHDQRMQRYGRTRVATAWIFVPRTPLPSTPSATSPLEVEGVFMPLADSARPLSEVIDPIGPIGYLFNCAIFRLRDDPKMVNLHQALAYLRAAYMRFAVTVTLSAGAGVTLRQAMAYAPCSFSGDYTLTYRTNPGKWLMPVSGLRERQWPEVKVLPDGSLAALGLRIWLDGAPVNEATLTIRLRATSDLEDPHLRLVQMQHPLPASADEDLVFTDSLLREMITALPELAPSGAPLPSWASLAETEKARFRQSYHRFLMLRESGRLVTLNTANVVLDLEISRTPALEQFKRLHRYIDVMKEYQELRRRALDNTRREELLKKNILGDPDIERVTLIGTRDDIKNVIPVPDGSDD